MVEYCLHTAPLVPLGFGLKPFKCPISNSFVKLLFCGLLCERPSFLNEFSRNLFKFCSLFKS